MMTMRTALLVATMTMTGVGAAHAGDVIRYKIPNSDFPISRAVEIPAGKTTVYVSGMTPTVIDGSAAKNTIAAYGDTKAQTISVFQAIEKALADVGLGLGDVVKMQVFLVGDPDKGGRMDFAGFMEGYRQFYGTKDQPNLPSRSAMQVAALANPGYLVEIEVTAVRP